MRRPGISYSGEKFYSRSRKRSKGSILSARGGLKEDYHGGSSPFRGPKMDKGSVRGTPEIPFRGTFLFRGGGLSLREGDSTSVFLLEKLPRTGGPQIALTFRDGGGRCAWGALQVRERNWEKALSWRKRGKIWKEASHPWTGDKGGDVISVLRGREKLDLGRGIVPGLRPKGLLDVWKEAWKRSVESYL